jgi:hypothetical protein
MKLSVVVPFDNELRTLPTVVDRLLAVDVAALGLERRLRPRFGQSILGVARVPR